jgi:uncharacterized protein
MEQKTKFVPTQPGERHISLDVLRGFAVLGILIMNIQNFSMISAAYINPKAYGDFIGLNKLVWVVSHLFADLKFMGLFSILFGAGIILITKKIESRGMKSTGIHYRRNFWLLVIGALHGYLLWSGDILFAYAVCGFLLFPLRKAKPKTLLILGIIVVSVSSALYFVSGLSIPYWPVETYQNTMTAWHPDAEIYAKEVAAMRGDFALQMEYRIPTTFRFQTFLFLFLIGWRSAGMMLVGMALYKWRILLAEKSTSFYKHLAIIGLSTGLIVIGYGIVENFKADWSLDFSMFLGWQYNYWGSISVSMGYIGVIMLLTKSEKWAIVTKPLSAVGRMAFTNYLLQTIICTYIFYGHGLGLFGQVERIWQLLIVFIIISIQLIISQIWLKYYQFGPAEWLWRSLTYLKFQPFKL